MQIITAPVRTTYFQYELVNATKHQKYVDKMIELKPLISVERWYKKKYENPALFAHKICIWYEINH